MSSTTPISSSSSAIQGGISSLGVGSGLDLNGIIEKLISIEQKPIDLLKEKKTTNQTKLSSLGTIQSNLVDLRVALLQLKNAGSSNSFTTTSSNASNVSASADSAATAATYTINVTTLAQAQSIAATGQTSTTAGIGGGTATTLTIDFGTITGGALGGGVYVGSTFTANASQGAFTVNIDNTNNSLEGIRDAINNSASNGGRVTASIVNDGSGTPYRLNLTSSSGADNSLRIGVAGDATLSALLAYDPAAGQNMTQQQVAQSAAFTVNGLPVTSNTNTVTTVATGVTFNLLTAASTATISVAKDYSDITTTLESVVESYNEVTSQIATDTAFQALLQGNSSLRLLSNQLTAAIFQPQSNSSTNYNNLSDLGVTLGSGGTLSLNKATLNAALAANPTQVETLVAAYGTSIGKVVSASLGTSGLISSAIGSINQGNTSIDKEIARLNARLTTEEESLRTRFAVLDALVASLKQTSDYLTQQFDNLNNQNK